MLKNAFPLATPSGFVAFDGGGVPAEDAYLVADDRRSIVRPAPVEVAHRACSACLLHHIAMKLPRPLHWDPVTERFRDDDEANAMLSRPQRHPYALPT